MTTASPPRNGIGRFVPPLLLETQFRRFWIGQTISVFGDQITLLALPIVAVLILHADPTQMGLLTAVGLLPHLLFSLPAGVWLDRVQDRRRLMILCDVGRALAIATIPVAFALGTPSLALLFLIAFVVGSLSVVFDISWNTLFVSVVRREQFVEASALLNGSRSLSSVAGPAISGALIQLFTAPIALVADALSYLGSVFFLRRITAPEPPIEREPGTIRQQLASGLAFIFGDRIMRPTILAAATLNLFNFCFQALFILYATTYLEVQPGILGAALGLGAIGGVLGAVFASRIGRILGIGRAYVLGLIVFPASVILIPLAQGLPETLVLAFLFLSEFGQGIGVMILDINAGAMIQARTPDRIRGRAMGAFRFINMGIRPIGATIGGVLGGLLGVRETLFIVIVLQLAGVLWLYRSPILGLRGMPEPAELGGPEA
jgi:MFS family permease